MTRLAMRSLVCAAGCLLGLMTSSSAVAAPPIEIVVAEDAPALELLAAKELSAYITQLSDAEVKITDKASADAEQVIWLGSPKTSALAKAMSKESISPQTVFVKSFPPSTDKPKQSALVVGGGSPVATLWAVHELAQLWGVEPLLLGDNLREEKKPIELKGFDVLLIPHATARTWRMLGNSPLSQVSWPLSDQKKLIGQLAKLKFNELLLEVHATQPFLDYEIGQVKKTTGNLWPGEPIQVDGDTPGRDAFAGAEFFENPDVPADGSYAERVQAAQQLLQGIIAAAEDQGMAATLEICPFEFPMEFKPALMGVETKEVGDKLVIVLEKDQALPAATFATVQIKAALKLHPSVTLRWPEGPAPDEDTRQTIATVLERLLGDSSKLVRLPADAENKASTRLVLFDPAIGILSQNPFTKLSVQVEASYANEGARWEVSAPVLGEADAAALYLSQAAFSQETKPKEFTTAMFTEITGKPDSANRLWKAWAAMDHSSQLMTEKKFDLATPDAGLFGRIYKAEPLPDWFEELVNDNVTVVTELYRSRSGSEKRGTGVLYYYAKRAEYVGFYLAGVKSLREAAAAKAEGDLDLTLEKMEMAIEQFHDSMATFGDVVQDQSDRAIIALMAEHVYRPLYAEYEKTLDAAEAAQ